MFRVSAVRSPSRQARFVRTALAGGRCALFAGLTLLAPLAAASPSLLKLDNFDSTFSTLCAGGTVSASGNKCEHAAVELKRGQNTGTGGNAELHARTGVFGDTLSGDLTVNGTTTSNTMLQSNALPWGSASTGTYTLAWRLEGNPDADSAFRLSITVDGTPDTTVVLDAAESSFTTKGKPGTDGSEQLWIRLRTLDGTTPGEVSLTGLHSQGVDYDVDPGTWTVASSASDANPYFLIQGLDFSQAWYVEGSALLSFSGTTGRERPAINWKFTQALGSYTGQTLTAASAVPEPATALMQGLALAVLGWRLRRAGRHVGTRLPATKA